MAIDVPNDAANADTNAAPHGLPPLDELSNFLSMMRIAMGLPPDMFAEKANGYYVIVSVTTPQISLFRNRTPLLQISWGGYPVRYAAKAAIKHPIAPMGDMLAPADEEKEYPVSREQAMKIAYTMLKYLTVENG